MSEPKYRYKLVELDDLKIEDGARELASSPEMQPYVRLGEAVVLGRDVSAEQGAIRQRDRVQTPVSTRQKAPWDTGASHRNSGSGGLGERLGANLSEA